MPNYPYLVAERDGQVIGYAYASQHRVCEAYRWSVDVTVYISPEAHRRGVGRALYDVLLPTLKGQGFHAAYAGIALPTMAAWGCTKRLALLTSVLIQRWDSSMVRGMILAYRAGFNESAKTARAFQ